jgi:hypothetical protein
VGKKNLTLVQSWTVEIADWSVRAPALFRGRVFPDVCASSQKPERPQFGRQEMNMERTSKFVCVFALMVKVRDGKENGAEL